MLHGKGESQTAKIWEIVGTAPKLMSKNDLQILKNYPRTPSSNNYLVYELKPIEHELFKEKKWDIRKLPKYIGGGQSSRPFAVTLVELFKALV